MPDRALILPALRRTAADAAKLATIVHEGQTDKAGRPYVEHLARVAAIVTLQLAPECPFWGDQEQDEAVQIAWLHDVVEDVEDGEALLEIESFSCQTIENVCWLSRGQPLDPGGSYLGWIRTIVEYAPLVVLLVKLADVTDNSDPDRLALLPEADRERLTRKYAGAKEALQAAARAKGWQG